MLGLAPHADSDELLDVDTEEDASIDMEVNAGSDVSRGCGNSDEYPNVPVSTGSWSFSV